jgi:hypothetical protein
MQFRCCNRPIGREKGRVEQILVEVDGKVTMMTRRYLNQSPVNVLVRGRSQGLEQAAVGEGSWLCSDIRVDLLVASRPQNFGQRLSALLPKSFLGACRASLWHAVKPMWNVLKELNSERAGC